MFTTLTLAVLHEKGAEYIFKQYKQKNVIIKPNYPILSVLKGVPTQFFHSFLERKATERFLAS